MNLCCVPGKYGLTVDELSSDGRKGEVVDNWCAVDRPQRLHVRSQHSPISTRAVSVPCRLTVPSAVEGAQALGYDEHALIAQTIVAMIVLPLS
jgi:hypothetical protein